MLTDRKKKKKGSKCWIGRNICPVQSYSSQNSSTAWKTPCSPPDTFVGKQKAANGIKAEYSKLFFANYFSSVVCLTSGCIPLHLITEGNTWKAVTLFKKPISAFGLPFLLSVHSQYSQPLACSLAASCRSDCLWQGQCHGGGEGGRKTSRLYQQPVVHAVMKWEIKPTCGISVLVVNQKGCKPANCRGGCDGVDQQSPIKASCPPSCLWQQPAADAEGEPRRRQTPSDPLSAPSSLLSPVGASRTSNARRFFPITAFNNGILPSPF